MGGKGKRKKGKKASLTSGGLGLILLVKQRRVFLQVLLDVVHLGLGEQRSGARAPKNLEEVAKNGLVKHLAFEVPNVVASLGL